MTSLLVVADNCEYEYENEYSYLPEQQRPVAVVAVNEELRDRMEVMFWQESSSYRTCDYLACDDSALIAAGPERDLVMQDQWRSRMLEWAYQCKYSSSSSSSSSTLLCCAVLCFAVLCWVLYYTIYIYIHILTHPTPPHYTL
jgi:hypothetical protein